MQPNPEFNAALADLRSRIDGTDRALLALLADRARLVAEVAALKRTHHQPVFHPSREEDLISLRRDWATDASLDPDFVEDIFRRMLRESRVAQSEVRARAATRPGASILIVGGRGQMGRCLTRWFEGSGYPVRSLDRDDWNDAPRLCAGIDLALLSVPIDLTADVARRIAPHLPASAVLADVTSLKRQPVRAMLEAHAGPVLGLHPMFGPTTHSMDRQIVVAVEGRDPAASRWVVDQMAGWGAVIVEATAEEHDEAMEVVQALRHFATFLFGQFLCRRRVDLQRSLDFSSPIYRLELAMVGRLFAQDPGLYSEIIFATPERRALLRSFVEGAAANLPMVDADDRAAFRAQFTEIATWFGPFSDQAIRESSYLIDKLIERF